MDAQKAINHYKERGDRVDEVLAHIVTEELTCLKAVIQQKNLEYDMRTNEAAIYRAALESIVKKDNAGTLMFSNAQMVALASHALNLPFAVHKEGEELCENQLS